MSNSVKKITQKIIIRRVRDANGRISEERFFKPDAKLGDNLRVKKFVRNIDNQFIENVYSISDKVIQADLDVVTERNISIGLEREPELVELDNIGEASKTPSQYSVLWWFKRESSAAIVALMRPFLDGLVYNSVREEELELSTEYQFFNNGAVVTALSLTEGLGGWNLDQVTPSLFLGTEVDDQRLVQENGFSILLE